MSDHSLKNNIFIIRTQAEYSSITKSVNVRCVLEMPMTGQQLMFGDVATMLTALTSEITELHKQIIPEPKEDKT